MAKSNKKGNSGKGLANIKAQLIKKRENMRLLCGLVFFALAAYTLIAIISYFFSWTDDQSSLISGTVMHGEQEIANNGGRIGAVWSDFLVSKLFGLGSLIVPFFFLGVALVCLRIKKLRVAKLLFGSLYGCIIFSLALAFIFSFTPYNNLFGGGAGGSYGYYTTEWLKEMLGNAGTGCVLLLLIIIWGMTISKRFTTSMDKWFENLGKPIKRRAADAKSEQIDSLPAEDEAAQGGEDTPDDLPFDLPVMDVVMPENSAPGESAQLDAGAAASEEMPEGQQLKLEILSTPEQPVSDTQETAADEELLEEDDDDEPEEEIGDPDDRALENMDAEAREHLFDPRLDLSSYQAPPVTLLNEYKDKWFTVSKEELEKNNIQIVKTLNNYKISIAKISARIGPTVTLYEVVPGPGVRVNQIKRLEQDIQLSLAAKGVRVVPLVGTNAVGIEVANEKPSTVSMRSCIEDPAFRNAKYDLPIAIGKSITNKVYTFDLAKVPHLLVAGATGQGKSVGLNAILTSLLYSKHPSELKLVLVDPKKVEFSLYSKIEKHYLAQLPGSDEVVVTDTQKVVYTLKSLCKEMDNRYDLLKLAGVRNIKEYNEKFLQRMLNPLKGHHFLPYIVVVIDEFADMIITAGREIEEPISRLAQLARAIGIHLVIATQRPTTSVITGNIKANFPGRIAFMVRSSIDSKTILDEVGANQLIGRGDMLISNGSDFERLQCAFIDTKEVESIVDFIGSQRGYLTPYQLPEYDGEEGNGGATSAPGAVDLHRRDEFFEDAARLIVMHQQGSTSLIQRKLNLGYARSGRIMDQLEAAGIVGPSEGSKARQVLVADFTDLDARLSNIKSIYG